MAKLDVYLISFVKSKGCMHKLYTIPSKIWHVYDCTRSGCKGALLLSMNFFKSVSTSSNTKYNLWQGIGRQLVS